MRGSGTSKNCVTNMAADEEATTEAVIAAMFLVNKEEEENRETVLDLPNVLAVLCTKERRHIPRITGYAYCRRRVAIFLHAVGNHLPNCLFLVRNITEKNLVLLVQ